MNKKTRKELSDLLPQLETIKDRIEEIQQEEQDKLDNMPEGLRGSDKGARQEQLAEHLSCAVTAAEELTDAISSAVEA